MYKKIKALPVNKTVVFNSPFEGDYTLVRTGNIGSKSCFYAALLHACYPDYVKMNEYDRSKFVYKLRASIAGQITRENWSNIANGLISNVPFQENATSLLINFYNYVETGETTSKTLQHLLKKINNFDEISLLTELIPLHVLEYDILPAVYEKTTNQKILTTKKEIIKNVISYINNLDELSQISEKKATYVRDMITMFLNTLLQDAENKAFRSYVSNMQNISEEADSYTIDLISNRFNRDIYILDPKTRIPLANLSTLGNLKKRESIIVIWIGGNNYEVVGRLLPGNRVQREFKHDDILIDKLYTFLLNSGELHKKYPELVQYIPPTDDTDDEDHEVSDEESVKSDDPEKSPLDSPICSDPEYYDRYQDNDNEE